MKFSFDVERFFDTLKWIGASVGWPMAFVFWFEIIVVLYASEGKISQLQLFIFHFLWIIIICAFFSALFTPPEKCRDLNPMSEDKIEYWEGGFCTKCDYIKPKRWHHCRKCRRCIDRMDHHCPILQMCIHRKNHKFFILFLFWPMILAIFAVYHGFPELWHVIYCTFTFEDVPIHLNIMGTGISNAMLIGFASTYLLWCQLPNLFRNQTLIEESNGNFNFDRKNWRKNFEQIMGPLRTSWLPIEPSLDDLKDLKDQ